MIYVSRGILNGAGDAAYSMINWTYGDNRPGRLCQAAYDDTGNWYVGCVPYDRIDMDTVSLVSMHRYARGKWRNKAIV